MHRPGLEQSADDAERSFKILVAPASDCRRAAVGAIQTEDDPHDGGLSGAVGTEEAGHLSWLDREAQMIDGARGAVTFGQLTDLDHATKPFTSGHPTALRVPSSSARQVCLRSIRIIFGNGRLPVVSGATRGGTVSSKFRGGWVLVLVAAMVTIAGGTGVAAAAPSPAAAPTGGVRWYLALGDSLSQGVQPDAAGHSVATNQGYADDLWGRLHARSPNLRLAKLGCPGETTKTMLGGGICTYAAGSQIAAAVAFLKSHAVALVTIDIGANDIDGCVSAAGIDEACYQAGVAAVRSNLPVLLHALRQAAPKVPVYAMNYYDPFVAAALKGGTYLALAGQS